MKYIRIIFKGGAEINLKVKKLTVSYDPITFQITKLDITQDEDSSNNLRYLVHSEIAAIIEQK